MKQSELLERISKIAKMVLGDYQVHKNSVTKKVYEEIEKLYIEVKKEYT